MKYGIHMPQKGGFSKNVQRAVEIGCHTLQIFLGNPTSWRAPAFKPEELETRRTLLDENEINPLIVHTAYLINLSSAKEEFYRKSRQLLQETAKRAFFIGAAYVVLHVGSHGGRGFNKGMELFVSTVREEMENWPPGVELLLENTAGGGTSLGGTFISIGNILDQLEDAPVGACLDTAHAWAAGYDFSSAEGLRKAMDELHSHIGKERLKLIHANDIDVPRGSRRDRHAHLGDGMIGEEGFRLFFSYSWSEDMPVILETPQMGSRWDAINMQRLRLYAGETS